MNRAEVLVPLAFFACLFGVFYLYYTSRNRERMALIEKGENIDLFFPKGGSFWKMKRFTTLNFALTSMGIGLGIVSGTFLHKLTGEEAMYPACIFLLAGLGLFIAFKMSKNNLEEN